MSIKNEVIVIGRPWKVGVMAEAFARHGKSVLQVHLGGLPEHAEPPTIAAYLGNGETLTNARLIFGESVADRFWEISQKSYLAAKKLFAEIGLSVSESKAVWFPEGAKEDGLTFSPLELEGTLNRREQRRGGKALLARRILHLGKGGVLDTRVEIETDGGNKTLNAPIVILFFDETDPKLLPSFSDKWIQVTLSSFSFPAGKAPEFSLALFNSGVDFAVREGDRLRVGSFRNLFMDKAVGVISEFDPATFKGVSGFFGKLGWINDKSYTAHLTVESLSCDGLPLVGTLPEAPGLYVAGAFSGKTANFIFEVAEKLALGICEGGEISELGLFWTKRFV